MTITSYSADGANGLIQVTWTEDNNGTITEKSRTFADAVIFRMAPNGDEHTVLHAPGLDEIVGVPYETMVQAWADARQ